MRHFRERPSAAALVAVADEATSNSEAAEVGEGPLMSVSAKSRAAKDLLRRQDGAENSPGTSGTCRVTVGSLTAATIDALTAAKMKGDRWETGMIASVSPTVVDEISRRRLGWIIGAQMNQSRAGHHLRRLRLRCRLIPAV